jgi:class 3 adenylate cyclase/CHASE2 domain-containing sensor protein
MIRRARLLAVCFALGACAWTLAWFGVRDVALLRQASLLLDDLRLAYFDEPRPQRSDVIVLAIDEDTVAQFPFRSPLNREFLATLVNGLAGRNVRAVGLDLIFDQPTNEMDDRRLLEALDAFPRPVVIAAGASSNGLTPRQLDFQKQYLAGRVTGLAGMLMTDGVVRHIYPGELGPGGPEPGFAVALAAALGVEPPTDVARLYYRAPVGGTPPVRSFPAQSLELLPAVWFDGSVVLIGADLPNQDTFLTPLSLAGNGGVMTGVEIHAQALAQLLDGSRYPAVDGIAEAALLTLAVLIGIGMPFLRMKVTLQLVAGLVLLATYWVLGFAYFAAGGALLPLLMPTLGFLLAISFGNAYARSVDLAEKRFIRETFRRYVSPSVINEMLENPSKLVLGGEKRELSFVFSDLEGFTTLSERLPPEEAVALLQNYLDGMLKIALEHGATIDRLVGDGIAVFFGAPVAQSDHASRAVRCALAWDRRCEEFRRVEAARGVALGVTRIGVHTGSAVVGNVGSAERFHYTAHGDFVNTAARLEGANRHLGTRICMSREVARVLPAEDVVPIGRLVLKGRTAELECVTAVHDIAPAAVSAYRAAYELLETDAARSAALFAELCREAPDHGLWRFHLRRLERGETGIRIVLENK